MAASKLAIVVADRASIARRTQVYQRRFGGRIVADLEESRPRNANQLISRGSVKLTTVPTLGLLLAQILPPCASTIPLLI
jgi:hypothetical protein